MNPAASSDEEDAFLSADPNQRRKVQSSRPSRIGRSTIRLVFVLGTTALVVIVLHSLAKPSSPFLHPQEKALLPSTDTAKLLLQQLYLQESSQNEAEEPEVHLNCTGQRCKVYANGEVYGGGPEHTSLRGLAAWRYYSAAKKIGAEAVRTWSLGALLDNSMLMARSAKLKVSAGIDLPQEAFRYQGEYCSLEHGWWLSKWSQIQPSVERYRLTQELLWWTVGNELESFISWAAGSPCLWKRIEWVAQKVKAVDSRHPVGTVIASFGAVKVKEILKYCPSLDFLGINVYGGDAYGIGDLLRGVGWTKPFAITEYGVPGSWMVPQTPWGANAEPITSTLKRKWFVQSYDWCEEDASCIGSFAFFWGWKWEKTGTWFGVYDEWGETGLTWGHGIQNDAAEGLARAWGQDGAHVEGSDLGIRQVIILGKDGIAVPSLGFSAERGSIVQIDLDVEGFEDKEPNKVIWVVTKESTSTLNGNLKEQSLRQIVAVVQSCSGQNYTSGGLRGLLHTAKLEPGAYRLYAFARHFRMASPAGCRDFSVGDPCWYGMDWMRKIGLVQHPDWFPGVHQNISDKDLQLHMRNTGNNKCAAPCDKPGFEKEASASVPFRICNKLPCDACYDVVAPQTCFWNVHKAVMKSREDGVSTWPVSGTLPNSSFAEFQSMLHRHGQGDCPQPCAIEVSRDMIGACESPMTFLTSSTTTLNASEAAQTQTDTAAGSMHTD